MPRRVDLCVVLGLSQLGFGWMLVFGGASGPSRIGIHRALQHNGDMGAGLLTFSETGTVL